MPGGKVHTAITLATTTGLVVYPVVVTYGNPYWYIAGAMAVVFLTPDHDVDGGNFTDTIIRKVSYIGQGGPFTKMLDKSVKMRSDVFKWMV